MKGIVKVSNEKIVFVAFATSEPGTVKVFAIKFETKLFEIFPVATLSVTMLAHPRTFAFPVKIKLEVVMAFDTTALP